MRIILLVCLITVSLLTGCHLSPNGSSLNDTEAQKLSNSYMSDLVADRVDLALDRRQAPMRGFYYSGRTTQHPKGVCFFAVRVVPAQNGMKVVNFGPLTLQSGQLPEWAR